LKKHISAGQTVTQIAALYSTSYKIIYTWMHKHKIPVKKPRFTESDDKYLRFNAGYISVPEMALHLRRKKETIYSRMREIGVSISNSIGYTVPQLSADIGVDVRTIRNWMRTQNLSRGEATGTYRISVDEISLYEWLSAGHIYRIPKIRPDHHHLMEIKRACDEQYVSSLELSAFLAKSHYTPTRGFPHSILQVKENGYGAIYRRQDVYNFLWENRYKLELEKIPITLPYWRKLCTEFDRQYIYRTELFQYVDYAASGNWYAYQTKYYNFPLPIGTGWIKYYSRSAVLEWSRQGGKFPKLERHLEQTTY
jgi:transposase